MPPAIKFCLTFLGTVVLLLWISDPNSIALVVPDLRYATLRDVRYRDLHWDSRTSTWQLLCIEALPQNSTVFELSDFIDSLSAFREHVRPFLANEANLFRTLKTEKTFHIFCLTVALVRKTAVAQPGQSTANLGDCTATDAWMLKAEAELLERIVLATTLITKPGLEPAQIQTALRSVLSWSIPSGDCLVYLLRAKSPRPVAQEHRTMVPLFAAVSRTGNTAVVELRLAATANAGDVAFLPKSTHWEAGTVGLSFAADRAPLHGLLVEAGCDEPSALRISPRGAPSPELRACLRYAALFLRYSSVESLKRDYPLSALRHVRPLSISLEIQSQRALVAALGSGISWMLQNRNSKYNSSCAAFGVTERDTLHSGLHFATARLIFLSRHYSGLQQRWNAQGLSKLLPLPKTMTATIASTAIPAFDTGLGGFLETLSHFFSKYYLRNLTVTVHPAPMNLFPLAQTFPYFTFLFLEENLILAEEVVRLAELSDIPNLAVCTAKIRAEFTNISLVQRRVELAKLLQENAVAAAIEAGQPSSNRGSWYTTEARIGAPYALKPFVDVQIFTNASVLCASSEELLARSLAAARVTIVRGPVVCEGYRSLHDIIIPNKALRVVPLGDTGHIVEMQSEPLDSPRWDTVHRKDRRRWSCLHAISFYDCLHSSLCEDEIEAALASTAPFPGFVTDQRVHGGFSPKRYVVFPTLPLRAIWKPSYSRTGKNESMAYVREALAYLVSKTLRLNRVPPVGLRSLKGSNGALVYWAEVFEEQRYSIGHYLLALEGKIRCSPPKCEIDRLHELADVLFYDYLISNHDRLDMHNNVFVDRVGRFIWIDHNRAFELSVEDNGPVGSLHDTYTRRVPALFCSFPRRRRLHLNATVIGEQLRALLPRVAVRNNLQTPEKVMLALHEGIQEVQQRVRELQRRGELCRRGSTPRLAAFLQTTLFGESIALL
eukprot:TRINITY_DN13271_c0_g1_i1.p1 TRINITY_DN13271_c0_g1~~TRINITY_DN13271_c0_g1_i1.p1  ORF type:complete len:955 (+),score=139.42 TRINITY_DN13271_c0_g1_i1:29-2866(+)